MKVNSDISFKGVYTNRSLKKGLEFASDNGALFASAATLSFSLIRPVSIWITPNTEKENRRLAMLKSIVSSLLGFGIMLGASIPLAKAVKKIDNSPEKYLKKETIDFLKDKNKNLIDSKGYIFGTQLYKLGLSALVAVPKAILTALTMFQFLPEQKDKSVESGDRKHLSFKSKNCISTSISKSFETKPMKNFINKYKDTNFQMHIMAITDTVSTLTFVNQISKSKKVPEDRKKPLESNALISTALSIISGYFIDSMLDKPVEKFINKYREINKGNPNLEKQIQGIKIVKPVLILGSLYYILIPMISTFLAEQTDINSKFRFRQ